MEALRLVGKHLHLAGRDVDRAAGRNAERAVSLLREFGVEPLAGGCLQLQPDVRPGRVDSRDDGLQGGLPVPLHAHVQFVGADEDPRRLRRRAGVFGRIGWSIVSLWVLSAISAVLATRFDFF